MYIYDAKSGIRIKALIKKCYNRNSVYFVKGGKIHKIEINLGQSSVGGLSISELKTYDPDKIYHYNENLIGNWGRNAKLTAVFDDEQVEFNGKPLPSEWFEDPLYISWRNLHRFGVDCESAEVGKEFTA
jgi:hypothetical protein